MVGTGLTASVAANVAHGMVSGGGVGAVVSGVFWPLGLLLAVEGATRLPWPPRWYWYVVRIAATSPVAAAAAIVSYLHMNGLLAHWHEHWLTQLIGPVAVDGLTTLGAAALLVLDRSDEPAQPAAGSTHDAPAATRGPARDARGPVAVDRPIEPTHRPNPQVTAPKGSPAPVSAEAVDKVLAVVRDGQPVGRSEIARRSGLSTSTTGRVLAHLTAVGRLTTVGESHRPSYVLTQQATHGATQGSAVDGTVGR